MVPIVPAVRAGLRVLVPNIMGDRAAAGVGMD